MKTAFSGYQIASLVRLVAPKFNVRINKAGNIAIEPSAVTNGKCTRKYLFYSTPEGIVIRTGSTTDTEQKKYSRLGKTVDGKVNYTFADFKEAFAHFKGTLRRGKYLA